MKLSIYNTILRYRERLNTKYDHKPPLIASSWTFLKDGLDDFRDGKPPPMESGIIKVNILKDDDAKCICYVYSFCNRLLVQHREPKVLLLTSLAVIPLMAKNQSREYISVQRKKMLSILSKCFCLKPRDMETKFMQLQRKTGFIAILECLHIKLHNLSIFFLLFNQVH